MTPPKPPRRAALLLLFHCKQGQGQGQAAVSLSDSPPRARLTRPCRASPRPTTRHRWRPRRRGGCRRRCPGARRRRRRRLPPRRGPSPGRWRRSRRRTRWRSTTRIWGLSFSSRPATTWSRGGRGAARARVRREGRPRARAPRRGAELELAMSLYFAAAIHCGLGRHADAIPVLERAVAVVTPPPPPPPPEGESSAEEQPPEDQQKGEEWALAAFSGWMQLGDTHAMLGRMDESIACYGKGLEIQMAALGERDPRVAETCRSKTLPSRPFLDLDLFSLKS